MWLGSADVWVRWEIAHAHTYVRVCKLGRAQNCVLLSAVPAAGDAWLIYQLRGYISLKVSFPYSFQMVKMPQRQFLSK